MKKASETNQDEVLDEAFYHGGGASVSWSVFGSSRRDPSEVLADREEGREDSWGMRAEVMAELLGLALRGWRESGDVEAVGRRVLAVAVAVGHAGGRGAGVVAMPGARVRLGSGEGCEVARRVLDMWFWGSAEARELGKKVLAIGLFVGHSELDGWSVRQLAKACGESRTWTGKRVRRECNRMFERGGGVGRAAWQQGEEQRRRSSDAQKEFYSKRSKGRKTTN